MSWIRNLFTFTNKNHLQYFLLTFPLFLILIYPVLDGNNFQFVLPGAVGHLLVTIAAFKVVIIDKKPSRTFSIACVWYNSIMALAYMSLGTISFLTR